jgi:hypothetical protein
MYRVEVIVIDDSLPQVGMDRPEVVKSLSVGSTYNKRDLAEKYAKRIAEWAFVNEHRITGKRQQREDLYDGTKTEG